MSKATSLINKVTALLEKRQRNTGAGLSFVIQLDDEPPTTIRTRGYQPHDNKSQPTQTTEDSTNE